jgi:hypothetical protein
VVSSPSCWTTHPHATVASGRTQSTSCRRSVNVSLGIYYNTRVRRCRVLPRRTSASIHLEN